jgi:hypothetical protein
VKVGIDPNLCLLNQYSMCMVEHLYIYIASMPSLPARLRQKFGSGFTMHPVARPTYDSIPSCRYYDYRYMYIWRDLGLSTDSRELRSFARREELHVHRSHPSYWLSSSSHSLGHLSKQQRNGNMLGLVNHVATVIPADKPVVHNLLNT